MGDKMIIQISRTPSGWEATVLKGEKLTLWVWAESRSELLGMIAKELEEMEEE